jgi:hypothetical protein
MTYLGPLAVGGPGVGPVVALTYRVAGLPKNQTSLPRSKVLLNAFWCWLSEERGIVISSSRRHSPCLQNQIRRPTDPS